MCGKGTTKTQTTAPPAYIASAQQNVINQAQNVAARPFQPYTGQLTAGLTPTQTNAAASLANVGPISAADINQYLSPYLNDVVNATQANINETNAEQQQALRGNAISAGAWGGDRAGVAAAELARQQNLAGQQTIANLYNQGYGTALSTAQQQQQNAEANAQALYGIGTQQQQTNQNALTAAYQQYLLQQQYPFATTQFLSGVVGQQTPGAGGTTTEKTSGSLLGDLFGTGAAILGIPTGGGGTLAGDIFGFKSGGGVPHRAMGGSNVLSMADALRRLPSEILTALHARMGSNPMVRNAMTTRPGFADGGMPYALPDSASLVAPSISSIVPDIAPTVPSLAAPQSSAIASNDATPAPSQGVGSISSLDTSGDDWASRAARSPLLAFGLGTLAGSNDPGASAIGRGGLAALQGIETRRKTDLDLALEREQLRGAGTENSLKDLQLKAYQELAGITSGGTPDVTGHVNGLMTEADAPVGDTTPQAVPTAANAVSGAPPAPVTAAPPAAGGAAPLFNTASLLHQYQIAARTPGMEGLATQLLGVINKGVPEGFYLGQDGGVYARPGYISGVGEKAAAEAAARAANTPHFTATRDAMGNLWSFDTRNASAAPIAGTGNQSAGPLSLADYTAKVTGSESGGNPNARNPASSATGLGQFTRDTWLNLMKANRPDLTKGQTEANILAMRTDPALSSEMTQTYARQNAAALTAAGLPVTSTSLYLAHGFGTDGAIRIMQSPENTPLTSILPKQVFDANPQLRNMTAGDVARNFAGKVGTDPVDVGNGATSSLVAPHDNTPATVETTAKAIANYQLAPLTGFAMRSPLGQAVMAKVAELNPDYNAGTFASRNRARIAFATGPQGDQVRAFNTSLTHLDTLTGLVNALGNGDMNAINAIRQKFATQFGAPAPNNFDAAKQIVGAEIVKAIVGKGGGVGEREHAADLVNKANSPQQLLGVINTVWKPLMGGQLENLRRQYEQSTGASDFFDKLSPEAIQQIGMPVGTIYKGQKYLGGPMWKPSSWKKKAA